MIYQDAAIVESVPVIPPHEALVQKFGNYDEAEFAGYLHCLFFAAIGSTLLVKGAQPPGGLGVRTERRWLSSALAKLGVAANTCGALFARGEFPDVSLVYRLVDLKRPTVSDHEAWADLRSVLRALATITADLFLLGRPRSRLDHIPAAEWERCRKFDLFALHHWRELFLTRDFPLLANNVVRAQIEVHERDLLRTVGPFNGKGSELTELCGWATAYGLSELGERLMANAYRYGIAYGWRKDWRLAERPADGGLRSKLWPSPYRENLG